MIAMDLDDMDRATRGVVTNLTMEQSWQSLKANVEYWWCKNNMWEKWEKVKGAEM
jgi:hypothetical protein